MLSYFYFIVFLSLLVTLSLSKANAEVSNDVMPFYRHLVYLKESGQQEKILPAVVKYEKQGLLKHEDVEARIVLARSYQDMGLYLKSAETLEGLIAGKLLKAPVLTEVYYYLAKNYYYQKRYADAENVIKKIKKSSADKMREEKDHLYTLIFLAQGKYQEAQDYSRNNWRNTSSIWGMYSKFNLAVALIKSGKTDQGMALLKQAGSKEGRGKEELMLLDKINQVLGYLLIRENMPDQSRQFFEKVRLQGGFSNLSLLGAGWASYMLQQYTQALVPWEELASRDIRDVSVQEAILIVPGVYEKLGRYGVAAEGFRKAIDFFQGEINQLDQVVVSIANNDLQAVIKESVYANEDNVRVLFGLSSSQSLHYLQQLNADKGFSKLLNDYWHLQGLSSVLDQNLIKVNSLKMTEQLINTKAADGSLTEGNLVQRSAVLKQEIDIALQMSAQALNQSALQLLEARKKHLGEYLIQARLSLVRIYEQLEVPAQKVQ